MFPFDGRLPEKGRSLKVLMGSKVTLGSPYPGLLGSGVSPLSVEDSGQLFRKKGHMVETIKIASTDTDPGQL